MARLTRSRRVRIPAEVGPSRPRPAARRAKSTLVAAAALFLLALLVGHDVHDRLTPGGTTALGAESGSADRLLESGFGAGSPHLILVADAPRGVDAAPAAATGTRLARRLAADPGVSHVTSYWDARTPSLRSRDGNGALILARLRGDDLERIATARRLARAVTGTRPPLTVTATGEAQVKAETQDRSEADLRTGELLAAPLTLAILLMVFGSLTAAVLPVLIGALSVAGTMAVLRLLVPVTDISVFAMSIATALGFALAVDFSLFIVTRFREELARSGETASAVRATMRTTGRAMAFSAATVTLSLTALLPFPFTIFRSIAYGGITVTVIAAAGSLVVLPAALYLLGPRIDGLPVPGPWNARRRRRRAPSGPGAWFRIADLVMRRPLLVAVPTAIVLIGLGSPFLGARFSVFDDRLLPPEAPAAQAADRLRHDFDARAAVAATTVVLPGERPPPAVLDGYARRVSALDGVRRVDTATGSYVHGTRVAGPSAPARFQGPAGTWLAASTAGEPYSVGNSELAERVRDLPAPGKALVGGPGAQLADIRHGIAATLPLGIGLIALTTFLLVAALTGSAVLGVKALFMNALSLGATFGVLVYVFQEGHLRWLVGDFTVSGSIDALVPALLFCIAFGLSMDYEIFLLSRITEEYRRTGDTRLAVATGLQHTGRLFTSAAVIFAVVMGALAVSGLALVKMIGVGLAVAVLLDATLIRGLLVPAVMRLAGSANWWTPRRLPVRSGRPSRP